MQFCISVFIYSTRAVAGNLLASFGLSISCNRKPTDSDSCHHYLEAALLHYTLITAAPDTEGRVGMQSYFNDMNSILFNEAMGEFCKFFHCRKIISGVGVCAYY